MKDNELQFNRSCHVLYSKPCKKEIQKKIALHYPETEREAVWEQVQRQYADYLAGWRTDLGGRKNFHNGAGGNYDCVALMAYYVVCKEVTSLAEIEEMEGNLFLPTFRILSKFVDCNKPLFRKLMHKSFRNAKNIECVLMATGIAEHIHSTRSLPKVLSVDRGSRSFLIQKPGCHVPQGLLHGARLICKAFRRCGMAEAAV